MANIKFDKEAAFKSIIGASVQSGQAEQSEPATNKKTGMETKKRISLAVYPSVYSDFQKIAYVDRQSASDIISGLIAEYVKKNQRKLEEYEQLIQGK